jgi:hypothetical protein
MSSIIRTRSDLLCQAVIYRLEPDTVSFTDLLAGLNQNLGPADREALHKGLNSLEGNREAIATFLVTIAIALSPFRTNGIFKEEAIRTTPARLVQQLFDANNRFIWAELLTMTHRTTRFNDLVRLSPFAGMTIFVWDTTYNYDFQDHFDRVPPTFADYLWNLAGSSSGFHINVTLSWSRWVPNADEDKICFVAIPQLMPVPFHHPKSAN